ncbi:PREDICTED: kinesin-like protein KIN-12F [Nelumbo nucifera]|uniref:Kinesin-like protein KIN-12F n=1 Tax=Nelumbo nucifera TaxID=4432 RepID=A0A1U8AQL7_NELNU|nr:PREDICTED: kinesin-like protein KIN-12F [Nelumbo nucifera]
MKRSMDVSENRFFGGISTQAMRSLLPRSVSNKQKTNSTYFKSRSDRENTPPPDPNIQIHNGTASPSIAKRSPEKPVNFQKQSTTSVDQEVTCVPSDPSVKIVVRIKPFNGQGRREDWAVQKISSKALTVGDRSFTFDSIVDSGSSQEDVFQLIGVPLVKNSLAGFNTSILSYGQTGSGKTYTMWGPPSSMVEGHSSSRNQGIVPRIFQMLFSEIDRQHENSDGKQINYQCRCSFLEIYNEQINDLLDPTRRNLEIRDDAKNGFYVENLYEEYMTSYEDVAQILIKGLSNRKVGATSINSKSSRSHIIFTCIIESWCKSTSSKCFSSSKTSRISLIDLAGSERKAPEDAGRQCMKEDKNVKKSLSQLGHLVNILAEGAESGKKDIPYRSSCLTHLLQESLGGNAKLTVICAISPDVRCKGETLSTLRFGQRAKCIQNVPVINEIREDDVNDLSDQIRQLKEELVRAKSSVHNSIGNQSGYFKGRNARENLNQLRLSLNRSLILPRIDNDSDSEEINVDEEDITELRVQLENLHDSCKDNSTEPPEEKIQIQLSSCKGSSEVDIASELDTSPSTEECNIAKTTIRQSGTEQSHKDNCGSLENPPALSDTANMANPALANSLLIKPCQRSAVLQDPTLSESPKFVNTQKKSMGRVSDLLASENHTSESPKFNPEVLRQSLKRNDHVYSSLRASNIFSPTESLAASLHRGLQIINHHQMNSASNKSSISFSFEHLALKPSQEVDKADAGVQTLPEVQPSLDGPTVYFLCASCKQKKFNGSSKIQDNFNMWIMPVEKAGIDQSTTEMPKDIEMVSSTDTVREKDLENLCAEQAAKIEQLNRLVEQYKLEREHSSTAEQGQVISAICPEALTNDEPKLLENNNKLLRYNQENPEKCEPTELKEEIDHEFREAFFDINEREKLLMEIQSLKRKLQSYTNSSLNESIERQSSSLLLLSSQPRNVDSHGKSDEEIDKERQRWTEMESEWISLTDELRIDLESKRRHAEKVEAELRIEKKCTEELDDALQRAVLGHARIVEHYAELQEKHNELLGRHRMVMEGIAEVKRAAAKAGTKKGSGSRFAKSLAAELSAARMEKEKEREYLKKENRSLKIQLRDTAEAVHAAGELLVRLRETEEAASVAEENFMRVQEENEKLKKHMEKLKRKHKMEMVTMKQYLAESRLPESALQPLYQQDSDIADSKTTPFPDDQAWRAEFGSIYQERY